MFVERIIMRTIYEEIEERLALSQNMEQLRENYEWLAEEYQTLNKGTLLMEEEITKRYGKAVTKDISETVAHKMTQQMLQELQDDGVNDSDLDVDGVLRVVNQVARCPGDI